jgi:hypothetical protein
MPLRKDRGGSTFKSGSLHSCAASHDILKLSILRFARNPDVFALYKPMTLTIEALSNYLGRQASTLLDDQPFKNWTFEKSVETDLEKPLINYVFARDGMDFVCDEDDKINCIFLYADESRCFKEGVQDLPFTSIRREVIARLGSPSKSGGPTRHPILGEYGEWDRFECTGYVIHIEYRLDAEAISKITLMRADVVP